MIEPSLGTLDERELARRATLGQEAAFAEIVRRHQGPVYRFCLRYLSPADAEDSAQETFVRAFTHRHRIDPDRPLLPWLLTVARHLSIDRLRRRESSGANDLIDDPDAHADTRAGDALGSAMTGQRAEILRQGLASLPEGQREAVMLFHVEGLAYKDIATTLEVPVGTVMTWLHRARARLKKLVESAEKTPE